MYIKIRTDEFLRDPGLAEIISGITEATIDGIDYIFGQVSPSEFFEISISIAGGTYTVSDTEI